MAWNRTLVLAAWLLLAGSASAQLQCGPEDAAGTRRCVAGLAPDLVRQMQATQLKSQWCWAASLQMIFARYGYAVPQEEIVERLYGGAHDLPVRTSDVTPLVARDWFDLGGKGFSARVVPHAVMHPTLTGHRRILQALADQHPLLLVTGRHVVVLVALQFEQVRQGAGLRITGGQVIDPTPGQGVRMLTRDETHPALLAQVMVRRRPAHFTSVAELQEPAPSVETALARGEVDAVEDTLNGAHQPVPIQPPPR